jgi:hypothetical protein
MYAQISSQMIRAQQAELERGSLAAQHRRALRESRGVRPRRTTLLRQTSAVRPGGLSPKPNRLRAMFRIWISSEPSVSR